MISDHHTITVTYSDDILFYKMVKSVYNQKKLVQSGGFFVLFKNYHVK